MWPAEGLKQILPVSDRVEDSNAVSLADHTIGNIIPVSALGLVQSIHALIIIASCVPWHVGDA